ncbi:MAG TPA: hypothetical protein VG225_11380 [Terracidiphilus sp.]|nr:hypothetical protein [Terracidiphilus sp.]
MRSPQRLNRLRKSSFIESQRAETILRRLSRLLKKSGAKRAFYQGLISVKPQSLAESTMGFAVLLKR